MVLALPIFRKSEVSKGSSGKRQRTASDASTTSLDHNLRLDRKSMSPNNRTNEWLKNTETPEKKATVSNVVNGKDSKKESTAAKSSSGLGIKGSKITKSTDSRASSSSRSSRGGNSSKVGTSKPRRQSWLSLLWSLVCSKKNEEEVSDNLDLEGATVIGETTPAKSPLLDPSLVKENSPASFLALEGDTTLIVNDSSMLFEDESPEFKEGQANIEELYRGWTEEEIWLFEKLDWRGYEPLLPRRWAGDFLTMYELLFTDDDSVAFIKSVSGKEYHAIKALRGLIKVSGHVRDRVRMGLSPEETLQREIESYCKWSMRDAGLDKTEYIPAIAIATAAPKESVAGVVGRVTDQLHHMGSRYRTLWQDRARSAESDDVQYYLHDLPTLYGVVIKYSVVSLVTYDVAKPGQAVRCLGTYNFQKEGQDIWHALAVSIIFIRARDFLMELREEGELGDEADVDSSDEDA